MVLVPAWTLGNIQPRVMPQGEVVPVPMLPLLGHLWLPGSGR